MEHPDRFATPVVAVLSGGNIDPLVLLHVIQHGMAAAARYLSLRVRLGDRPGALAGLLTLVGEHGGNVLDVAHARTSVALPARARSTCACPWRRAARSTAPSWWRPSRPRATVVDEARLDADTRARRRRSRERNGAARSEAQDPQARNGSAETSATFMLPPSGSWYSRVSPTWAPMSAAPSGELGDTTSRPPRTPSSREPSSTVSVSSSPS